MTGLEREKLEQKLRFQAGYQLGFACPDIEELVQETMRRLLGASPPDTPTPANPESGGALAHRVCRKVISEYRRRSHDGEPKRLEKDLPQGDGFQLGRAMDEAMQQFSSRDRQVLHAFYMEERPLEEVLEVAGLTADSFRVVLRRAKERFRQIYCRSVQFRRSGLRDNERGESRYHTDHLVREQSIALYLARKLSADATDEFESHYLACDDCFEEMRAAELLICGLGQPAIESFRTGDVTVVRFTGAAQLTVSSSELNALIQMVDTRGDRKVLIDLRRVSRIDSTGLGMLIQCFAHAVRQAGALKLLQPPPQVRRILSLTKIDSVVPTFDDEIAALRSFD